MNWIHSILRRLNSVERRLDAQPTPATTAPQTSQGATNPAFVTCVKAFREGVREMQRRAGLDAARASAPIATTAADEDNDDMPNVAIDSNMTIDTENSATAQSEQNIMAAGTADETITPPPSIDDDGIDSPEVAAAKEILVTLIQGIKKQEQEKNAMLRALKKDFIETINTVAAEAVQGPKSALPIIADTFDRIADFLEKANQTLGKHQNECLALQYKQKELLQDITCRLDTMEHRLNVQPAPTTTQATCGDMMIAFYARMADKALFEEHLEMAKGICSNDPQALAQLERIRAKRNSNATNTAHPSPFRRQHQAPNQNIDRQPMAKQAKSAEEIFTACLAERIARLEEENNKLGVKLEAVTKLALEMARRSGEVELIREFSIAVGDV
ncbi:hypothetical protein N0V88_006331 [Collariella sp. IMI 366227]|nr:hypothetical protein N0V88_006331 [Collariella sp. IMI 366227]